MIRDTRLGGIQVEQGYGLFPSTDLLRLIDNCQGRNMPGFFPDTEAAGDDLVGYHESGCWFGTSFIVPLGHKNPN